MKKAIMIILLFLLISGVVYFGISIYANLVVFREVATGSTLEVPDAHEAGYIIKLVNTGRILYTDNYTKEGTVCTLHGYWELVEDEFVYREQTLTLDEKLFGAVLVSIR